MKGRLLCSSVSNLNFPLLSLKMPFLEPKKLKKKTVIASRRYYFVANHSKIMNVIDLISLTLHAICCRRTLRVAVSQTNRALATTASLQTGWLARAGLRYQTVLRFQR